MSGEFEGGMSRTKDRLAQDGFRGALDDLQEFGGEEATGDAVFFAEMLESRARVFRWGFSDTPRLARNAPLPHGRTVTLFSLAQAI